MQFRRVGQVCAEELGSIFRPRLWLLNGLPRLLPAGAAGRIRAHIYRLLGVSVGERTLIGGALTLSNQSSVKHLVIGAGCFINSLVYIDAAAPVRLGDGVSIGHHVVMITSDHAIGPPEFRAGTLTPRPITVGNGAWIAAGVVVLPGVTIGPGAVVAAGAVVTQDVAPHTLVGGVPARLIRRLTESESPNLAALPVSLGETIPGGL
jgi:maltose O-acetyltransferase